MKKLKAFSLAEIMVAITLMGVIASLTLPTMTDGMVVKERLAAYSQAFNKVKEVAAMANVDNSYEKSGQAFWAHLNDSLPVIGYTKGTTEGKIINTTVKDLKPRANWHSGDDDKGTTIGLAEGEIVKSDNGYSPWIVTENGMAFAVNALSYYNTQAGLDADKCATVMQITRQIKPFDGKSIRESAGILSCVFVLVDVNGLNKGPNSLATDKLIQENEMHAEVKNHDRFMIFVANNGVSAGPEGLAEYWMTKRK